MVVDEHVQPAADNFIKAQDQTGDYHGQNFNGGVSGVVSGDGNGGGGNPGQPGPIQVPLSDAAKESLQADANKGMEESLAGAQDTQIGQRDRPKYRYPTQEEVDDTMAVADGAVSGVGGIASIINPLILGSIATLGGAAYLGNRPRIQRHFQSKRSEPVYENWDENDYQDYYRNWN